MVNLHDQNNSGRKGLVWLTLPHYHSSLKEARARTKEGRNPEAGADAEAWSGAAYWIAPHCLLSLIYNRAWDHQPRDGSTHNGLGSTSSTARHNLLYFIHIPTAVFLLLSSKFLPLCLPSPPHSPSTSSVSS